MKEVSLVKYEPEPMRRFIGIMSGIQPISSGLDVARDPTT